MLVNWTNGDREQTENQGLWNGSMEKTKGGSMARTRTVGRKNMETLASMKEKE